MTEFEQVLQECLRDLEQGASNLDACLARHPKHAQQLMPILLTHAYLEGTRGARPSAAFKARVRAKLTQGMQAYPRRKARPKFFPFMQLAASFVVILLALATAGTAYAQRALPGNFFYGWKLASEHVWRTVSPDPVGTDLAIADRRVDELIAVGHDPMQRSQVQENYLEVVTRLRSEIDAENQALILSTLDAQTEQLNQSGISVPQPAQPQLGVPTSTPTTTPEPTAEPPTASPTDLPQIIIPTQTPEVIPSQLPTAIPTWLPTIVPSLGVP